MKGRLELAGLTKSFGAVLAVDDVSLAVEPGELFTLLGPSGSGKTTILRLIAGFQRPSAGRILIDGNEVSPLSPAQRGVGVVFQDYALFPHMTVDQNVAYPLRMRHVSRRSRAEQVAKVLELVQLQGLEARVPAQLSGGQQQRVALARALVFGPRLLLMDEPLGALDRALRVEMEEELRRIHRETGVTILYVTHDQEEALVLSDRIGVLRAGRLLQAGAPKDLFEAPTDTFVARFFGECNLFPADLFTGNGASPREGLLLLRPGDLRISQGDENGAVTISATVEDVLYLGQRVLIRCVSELGAVVAEAPARRANGLAAGDQVSLSFDPAKATLVPGESPT
jgi:putative spermidine/putrescine transport system ATP-binding protein